MAAPGAADILIPLCGVTGFFGLAGLLIWSATRDVGAQTLRRRAIDLHRGGDLDAALPLYEQWLGQDPSDFETAGHYAAALIDLDRARDALAVLARAIEDLKRAGEEVGYDPKAYEANMEVLLDLHHTATRATGGAAEKGIDAPATLGVLDPRAGGNYKLIGYSKLIESKRTPRRIPLPSQAELARAIDEAERAGNEAAAAEDDGLKLLREHKFEEAIEAFEAALDLDGEAWPALIGKGAAMKADKAPPLGVLGAAARNAPPVPRLDALVRGWAALTTFERTSLALCVAPLAWPVARILEAGGRFDVVSLDARITDLEAFAGARGSIVEEPEDRRQRDAIGGLARGPHAAVRVEELGWGPQRVRGPAGLPATEGAGSSTRSTRRSTAGPPRTSTPTRSGIA